MSREDQMIGGRSLADSLDALFAGEDTDSGIRDSQLLAVCVAELKHQAGDREKQSPYRMGFLDIAWDLSVELYGREPYDAETRFKFIYWLCDHCGWDTP